MAQAILEMAKDLVMAQIEAGALPREDMQKALQQTYQFTEQFLKINILSDSLDCVFWPAKKKQNIYMNVFF